MIRRIRDLLYDQGFTISGARNKLQELVQSERDRRRTAGDALIDIDLPDEDGIELDLQDDALAAMDASLLSLGASDDTLDILRKELLQIRDLLSETR